MSHEPGMTDRCTPKIQSPMDVRDRPMGGITLMQTRSFGVFKRTAKFLHEALDLNRLHEKF
jgi:hypothetical protein